MWNDLQYYKTLSSKLQRVLHGVEEDYDKIKLQRVIDTNTLTGTTCLIFTIIVTRNLTIVTSVTIYSFNHVLPSKSGLHRNRGKISTILWDLPKFVVIFLYFITFLNSNAEIAVGASKEPSFSE